MAFFIISIALGILIFMLLMFTVYMYVKLVIAVKTNTEVPNKNSDTLKNCTITYYEIPGDSEVLSKIKFNNTV